MMNLKKIAEKIRKIKANIVEKSANDSILWKMKTKTRRVQLSNDSTDYGVNADFSKMSSFFNDAKNDVMDINEALADKKVRTKVKMPTARDIFITDYGIVISVEIPEIFANGDEGSDDFWAIMDDMGFENVYSDDYNPKW